MSININIRKTCVNIEEIRHEGGHLATTPLMVVTAAAVIDNPYAGHFQADLMPYMAELRELGRLLAQRVVVAAGGAHKIEAYGKGAIVGEDGELEHGALWHEAGGWALRAELGERKAIVPAAKTVGTLGCRLMVPLGHTRAAYVRSHFNTAELTIWDAPRRREIVFALCVATGARIHERAGGLRADAIQGLDGQR